MKVLAKLKRLFAVKRTSFDILQNMLNYEGDIDFSEGTGNHVDLLGEFKSGTLYLCSYLKAFKGYVVDYEGSMYYYNMYNNELGINDKHTKVPNTVIGEFYDFEYNFERPNRTTNIMVSDFVDYIESNLIGKS